MPCSVATASGRSQEESVTIRMLTGARLLVRPVRRATVVGGAAPDALADELLVDLPSPAFEVGEPPRGEHEQKPTVSTRPSPVRLLTRAVNTTGSVSRLPAGVRISTLSSATTPLDRATMSTWTSVVGFGGSSTGRSLTGNVNLSDSRWTSR